jgi:hypothetical protein
MSESESFEATVGEYSFGDKALFLAGKRSERERIIKLLVEADTTNLTVEELKGWYFALTLIKGETNE